ncbi:oxygen-independent coproporphyrinogen III oxidase [Ketogulonicigenium robustum]|uniref:Heme chaperone HemW n=1 Tax=Ketogulonicigenium robustum TaxID=92947 RepID=A0A1W6P2X1_9RHOB|nr:radical SAM family heme chaperone HemW [Ketogulonicigenium robustum]ARO15690.1 oxygen-independent coproporphyrinogen III oxidase [Ketogulonicigenium robustum]
MSEHSQYDDWRDGGFGLYIHWPFCMAKCPYCDFNSHVAQHIDQNRWAAAYEVEIDRIAAETDGRVLNSVFFGGGTPSLMQPEIVDRILNRVRARWSLANDVEITLEANPTSVEAGRFRGYRDAGVNRVSMGVQAMNDTDLRALGRMHSVAEARQAFDTARAVFDRVSFDLIYARQNQTAANWRDELHEALSMAVDHLSLYQLTIEPNTAFGARYDRGLLRGLPDEDHADEMWDITQEVTDKLGFPAYEISNHARAGAESRHNSLYWRYGDYAGIGPGAHGRLTFNGQRFATETPLAPGKWLEDVEKTGKSETVRDSLSATDQLEEYVMMGLRLSEGLDLQRLQRLSAGRLDNNIARMIDIGMLQRTATHLRTTAEGRPVLNAILREVLAD